MQTAFDEKRKFPRIPADCPILYKKEDSDKWILARLLDISATGLSMICAQALDPDVPLEFQIKPGGNRLVPELSGHCKVTRSVHQENEYMVSCKISRINRNKL